MQNDRTTAAITPRPAILSPPRELHVTYYIPLGTLEWTSHDGLAFRIDPEQLFAALPRLRFVDLARPGSAATRSGTSVPQHRVT